MVTKKHIFTNNNQTVMSTRTTKSRVNTSHFPEDSEPVIIHVAMHSMTTLQEWFDHRNKCEMLLIWIHGGSAREKDGLTSWRTNKTNPTLVGGKGAPLPQQLPEPTAWATFQVLIYINWSPDGQSDDSHNGDGKLLGDRAWKAKVREGISRHGPSFTP